MGEPNSNAGVYGNHSNDFQSKYENSNVDHPYLLKQESLVSVMSELTSSEAPY